MKLAFVVSLFLVSFAFSAGSWASSGATSRVSFSTDFCVTGGGGGAGSGSGPGANPYCALMAAIGQCASPNNPYRNGLRALSGNNMQIDSWSQPNPDVTDFEITVTRDSGRTLKRNVGTLKLHTAMIGVGPSAKLICSLQVVPAER